MNAFEYLGGVPRRCLYDNAKVVTLGKDEAKRPIWNQRMLDFSLRVGFEARLCREYRPPSACGATLAEHPLHRTRRNGQALEWCDAVANARIHGDQPGALGDAGGRAAAPGEAAGSGLAPYLRVDRKVSRDGFVSWEGSH